MLPNVPEHGSFLTCELLRQELQLFAQRELRNELADFSCRMQQELRGSMAGEIPVSPVTPPSISIAPGCFRKGRMPAEHEGSESTTACAKLTSGRRCATESWDVATIEPDDPVDDRDELRKAGMTIPSALIELSPPETRPSVTDSARSLTHNHEEDRETDRKTIRPNRATLYSAKNSKRINFSMAPSNSISNSINLATSSTSIKAARAARMGGEQNNAMVRQRTSETSDVCRMQKSEHSTSSRSSYRPPSMFGLHKLKTTKRLEKTKVLGDGKQTAFQEYLKRQESKENGQLSAATTRAEKTFARQNIFSRVCLRLDELINIPVAAAIGLNGVVMGAQTQYQSLKVTEELPLIFPVMEVFFWVFFLSEIVIRIAARHLDFFTAEGWRWNIFDLVLVIIQTLEVISMLTGLVVYNASSSITNLTFMRLLRILRLLRVLRIVRLLQFVSELNTIVSSIINSMRSLFWTLVLLIIMIYIIGIVFAQVVLGHRIENKDESPDDVAEELSYWWGTLFRSTLTLYEAILGGADWDGPLVPLLEKITVFMGPIFILYIAFALLAMMNVITGVFVESALKNAARDKDKDFVSSIRDLFEGSSNGDAGIVTQEVFEERISEAALQMYLKQIGIDAKDAKLMFSILDGEGTGVLDLEELLVGMLRLRSRAKVLDIALLMMQHEVTNDNIEELSCQVQEVVLSRNTIQKTESKSTRSTEFDSEDNELV